MPWVRVQRTYAAIVRSFSFQFPVYKLKEGVVKEKKEGGTGNLFREYCPIKDVLLSPPFKNRRGEDGGCCVPQ